MCCPDLKISGNPGDEVQFPFHVRQGTLQCGVNPSCPLLLLTHSSCAISCSHMDPSPECTVFSQAFLQPLSSSLCKESSGNNSTWCSGAALGSFPQIPPPKLFVSSFVVFPLCMLCHHVVSRSHSCHMVTQLSPQIHHLENSNSMILPILSYLVPKNTQ